jgi:type II secretory pathway component PulF
MDVKIIHFGGLVIGIIISVISFFTLYVTQRNMFYFVMVLCFILSVLPFMISFLVSQNKQKEKEEKFLEFTRDLVEAVRSGTPVNKAKETKSSVIARAVILISEAQKAGGKIETIISAVAKSVSQIDDLKKKRTSSIYNLVVQGYIIFFVFIIIMLVLEYAILPLAVEFSQNQIEGLNERQTQILSKEQFSTPLFVMLLVQAIFAGLVVGKISEGTIFGGIKHSFLLFTVTLFVVTGTRAFLG